MEESEKRRERLRAMRAEAAQAENSNSIETTPGIPCYLSNPLIETTAAMLSQEASRATPRFDFYTDPMAAFSANKRRNTTSNQSSSDYYTPPVNSGSSMLRFPSSVPGPRNTEMTPLHHQFQSNYSLDQRMYQPRGFGHNYVSHRAPIGISRPFYMDQGNLDTSIGPSSAAGYNFPTTQPRGHNFPCPRFSPTGSPSFNAGQGRAHWLDQSASPVSGHGGGPSPSSGRGGNRWRGSSPSPNPGRRGGRGLGSSGRPFTTDRPQGPEGFYDDSMIEDPWKFLTPVIWKEVDAPLRSLSTPDSSRSLGMKKTTVSDALNKSNSQPSLAEYLAASFNEAVNDAPST
ncbi:M-phase-specific PLK1-interacting protein-like [Trema orientale]|uniref:M-phase-specific PLK1-interacting protein-like n=1 Tax=Trema orientale TaxID=63057 RepID=A0A2P5EWC8_TREOI|nr:M-phase-specific PLK1-interacting protein-like [Trema orientale]